jgi:hypothetical protein
LADSLGQVAQDLEPVAKALESVGIPFPVPVSVGNLYDVDYIGYEKVHGDMRGPTISVQETPYYYPENGLRVPWLEFDSGVIDNLLAGLRATAATCGYKPYP